MMNTKLKIGLIIVIVVIGISWYVWDTQKKIGPEKCGDAVLNGYLVTGCPWQAYPFIPDYKSNEGLKCDLDIWLSEESMSEEQTPDICSSQPLTSGCFLEQFSLFNHWKYELGPGFYPKVTLIGKYEKIKVCHLLAKCIEPECIECNEENVLVPCEIIEK